MSSLLEFLQKERKLNWKFWFRYYHQHLLSWVYSKNKKENNSWKGIKIAKTTTPEGWTKENAFEYLEVEYKKEKMIMKRFKD